MKESVRAHTTVTYHGRTRKPMLHWTNNGRAFVMVRATKAEGGGTKRLYLDTKRAKKAITKGYTALRKEARQRRR